MPQSDKNTRNSSALLALADGSVFYGVAAGARTCKVGELVFHTGMSGYQEILSDPSYHSQILNFTYPHIGNVGVNNEDWESKRFQVAGMVARHIYPTWTGHRGVQSLQQTLEEHNIPAITNIDTRAITQRLRTQGAISACVDARIESNKAEAIEKARSFKGLSGMDLTTELSNDYDSLSPWYEGRWHWQNGFASSNNATTKDLHKVVVYDFGVKRSVLRLLADACCEVRIVNANTSVADALAFKPQGIVFSNGPGDPAACHNALALIREFIKLNLPLLGICLGCQMLALALGAKTKKMKFGHHGANHPVQKLKDARVWVTSQNHGFEVDEASLPQVLQPTHRSLFDGSLQGFAHTSSAIFGFQGHPEAGPGPQDAEVFIDDFIQAMQIRKSNA